MITLPPDLAVEVVSPTACDQRRDRVDKMDEYGRFGIRFYWLVDPQQPTVEIYERGADGRYVRRVEAGSGSIQGVPGCAGLTLDLDAMWSKIDALDGH